MVKFVHTSDWQIGMKGTGLGDGGALVAEQRIETIHEVLRVAESEGADFVLASGDLFEDNRVAETLVEAVARVLSAHSVEVHAIPGNHDHAGPGSVWNRSVLRGVPNLHVHVKAGPVPLAGGSAVLYPFPLRSRFAGSDPLAGLELPPDSEAVQLGMAHGHLTTVSFGAHEGEINLPIDPANVEGASLDYLALGHWHGTRIVKTPDGCDRIAYSGTHEQTSFRETDAGNVLVVDIESRGASPKLRKLRTGALRWVSESLHFAGDSNLDRLQSLLESQEADFLRLELSGELPLGLMEGYGDTLARASGRFRFLRVRDGDLRFRGAEKAEPMSIGDAGLEEVQGRILKVLGEEAAGVEAREAMIRFRRLVREAGL